MKCGWLSHCFHKSGPDPNGCQRESGDYIYECCRCPLRTGFRFPWYLGSTWK